jgi:hypothetical protein
MRGVAFAVGLTAVLVACSGDDEPECVIAGTYTMTATPESQSEGCADLGSGEGPPTTLTITERPPGATGPDFAVEMSGLQGGCAANKTSACQIQTKCDVVLTDATDPANNVATLQFSWTFTESGFSGLNSGAFPAAKTLPRGCNFTSKATASRR